MLLLAAAGAWAQVQVGENTSINLSGNLSTGYTGDFSNYAGSNHGLNFGGNADLNGYYYSPGFVSFDIQPFYNQSRENSDYQSVFDASGIAASASIFGGSNFPGTITYTKAFNSEGGFALPQLGNITTHADSQNLGIGWGVHVPGYPNVSFQFMDGDNTSSIFGTSANATSHVDTFGVNVSDRLAGFTLTGGYHYDTLHAETPSFLIGESSVASDSSGSSFNVGVGHTLPLNGAFSVGYSRSDVNSDFTGGSYSATIDTVNAGAGFQPIRNLNVNTSAQYTDNLGASLYQPIINSGGVVPPSILAYTTNALDVNSQVNYLVPAWHLTLGATIDHRDQTTLGESISSNTFTEMLTYGNSLLGGFLNATTGVTQTSTDLPNSPSTLGFFENVSYTRQIQKWSLSAAGNFTRNTQTVLVSSTSSGYGYTLGIGRKIGTYSHWSLNAGGTKSTFSGLSGASNLTQSYSTGLSLRRISLAATYARTSGTSIFTPTGLVPVPVPIVNPAQAVLLQGTSYGASIGTHLYRGLTISGSYSKVRSNTLANSAGSLNTSEQVNGLLYYKLRQLWIVAGYLKINQSFSILGTPPASGTSFYAGISRWFKFF